MKDIAKYFGLQVDGRGYAGEVASFTPPELTLAIEDKRAGGMDAPEAVDMGMEGLTCSWTIFSYDRDLLALWGLTANGRVAVSARASLESADGTKTAVKLSSRGLITQLREGEWTPGQGVPLTFTQRCDFFERTHGGVVVHRIDIPNMVRVIGGTDQLEEHRRNIGR